MADGVRHFEREDIPQVAALFMRTFRRGRFAVSEDLLSYIETVFFLNPWFDPEIRSLVYEEAGDIIGFIGVIPRRMRMSQRVLRTAVVGNYMFDHAARTRDSAFGAVEIIRRLIEGPQDLTISDTANDKSRGIWEMCGGLTSYLYSLRWLYAIRPFALAHHLSRRWVATPGAGVLSLAAGLLAPPADLAFRLAVGARFASKGKDGGVAAALTASDIIEGLPDLRQYQLFPYYEEADLAWLLEMAARKRTRGELRAQVVKDASARTLGWFVYYRNPSGTSQVLQLAATPDTVDSVFDRLVEDASRSRTLGLTGRLCPSMAKYLTKRRCVLASSLSWALIHARDPDVVQAFDRGAALFSGLESEQWLRFVGGDTFQD